MRLLFFLLFFFFVSVATSAQSLAGHLTGGEDESSSHAIQNFNPTPEIQGFRICIFSGSEQDARANAKKGLELFYSEYPDINGEIVYESPIFKVVVGACLNRIEAIQLLSRVKNTFPKAFIISCVIPINDFTKKADSSHENKIF